ncbi:hypothetical protein A2870_04645 [Candidatus Curtissbacteria bacterium RIFCSPHIGHO2_01_FULL_41_11]|uniref:Uncharacterized protein n=1 Tax=Candidatus Curtissbacteria bacterium RIFCSPHIGHO2_01_FULL_41_11 TaxID=1797711 RepID=A0A1F5G5G4_9BACT|nr:MAG: hypothetical protein A2870_04645 [Candidatus Curtissbacteria bacterium RIFCSPHIGHO2_01_FULL_41_11]
MRKVLLVFFLLYFLIGFIYSTWKANSFFDKSNCANIFGVEKCGGYQFCTAEFSLTNSTLFCTNSKADYLPKVIFDPGMIGKSLLWPLGLILDRSLGYPWEI